MIRFLRDCQAFYQSDFTIFLFSWVVYESSSSPIPSPMLVCSVFSIVAITISVYWCLIMVKCECAILSDLPLWNHWIGKHHPCKDFGYEFSCPWVPSAFRAFIWSLYCKVYWKLPTSHTYHSVTDLFTPPFSLSPKWENAILIVLLFNLPYIHFHTTTYRSTPPF